LRRKWDELLVRHGDNHLLLDHYLLLWLVLLVVLLHVAEYIIVEFLELILVIYILVCGCDFK
jgi:hypothetical protein